MFKKKKHPFKDDQVLRYLRYLRFIVMPPPKKDGPQFKMEDINITDEEKQELIDRIEFP